MLDGYIKKEPSVAELKAISDKYHELLFAVENKIEGESRHETALRIIKEHERGGNEAQEAQG